MMKMVQRESVIIRSLPIQKKFKRLITLKFNWLVRNNGPRYASDVFSEYRTLILRWLSGELTETDLLQLQRFGKNLTKRILPSIRSNPHSWIDLLKIYTSFGDPVQPVSSSALDTHKRINRCPSESAIKTARMIARLNLVSDSPSRLQSVAHDAIASAAKAYRAITLPGPNWYCDAWNYTSDQYQDDLLCAHTLSFDKRLGPIMEPVMELMDTDPDFLEGGYEITPVGMIHHIPKKGTVKRRAIAVPNRFVQSALAPLQEFVRAMLKRMPEDCSFDQNKFTSRVSQVLRDGGYVGSADLSAASDNLPREIAIHYLWTFADWHLQGSNQEAIKVYLNAFERLCEGPWENEQFFDAFKVGQPLGTLPSFPILALSNHLICRAAIIGLFGNYVPNQYAVLGDDVIFFNKDLRDLYLELVTKLETPVSLHKSYEGRIVEFAGRLFIRNQSPSYTPDHAIVHFGNLFDYQRAARINIPWSNLPKKIRKRWARDLSTAQAKRAYEIVQALETGLAPSAVLNDEALVDTVTNIALARMHKDAAPAADTQAYLTPVYGKLVKTARQDGFTTRDKSTEAKDWFKEKWRPVSTESLRLAVSQAFLSPHFHEAVQEEALNSSVLGE